MKKICIYLIEWYQKNISSFLENRNIRCKYYPSCSEYTKQAIEKYGVINTKGEEVIPCQYDRARSFSDGFAVVYLAYYDAIPPIKGLIDKKGNTTFTQEDWDEYEKWKRKKE